MPRLSIIIPCRGCPQLFENTLASVLQNRPDDCEVLVALDQPYPDPFELGDEVTFLEVPGGSDLVQLINAATGVAAGEILHILGCDLQVKEGWVAAALEAFADPRVAAVCPLVIQREAEPGTAVCGVTWHRGARRVVATSDMVHVRRRGSVLGPALTASFWRQRPLQMLGGFSARVGETGADIDAALALQALGLRTLVASRSVVQRNGTSCETKHTPWRMGLAAERLYWRHRATTRPGLSLIGHALGLAAELLTALVRPARLGRSAGRLAALGTLRDDLRYRAHVQQLVDAIEREGESPVRPLPPRPASVTAARPGRQAA